MPIRFRRPSRVSRGSRIISNASWTASTETISHGRIDEEQHYQFVKRRLKESGVGYYDVFKFHFGYHSIEEAKQNPGMVRAFERLKKEGLVKHLAISQHHYNSIGGDMAWEILTYLADNRPYEATQFFYTYGDRKEVEEWIDLAKKKDIGTIAMKSMGGVGRAANDPSSRSFWRTRNTRAAPRPRRWSSG